MLYYTELLKYGKFFPNYRRQELLVHKQTTSYLIRGVKMGLKNESPKLLICKYMFLLFPGQHVGFYLTTFTPQPGIHEYVFRENLLS